MRTDDKYMKASYFTALAVIGIPGLSVSDFNHDHSGLLQIVMSIGVLCASALVVRDQWSRRSDAVSARIQALVSATDSTSSDVGRLVGLAHELSKVATLQGLREALTSRLKPLLPTPDICILIPADDGMWQEVVGPGDAQERKDAYSWTTLYFGGDTVGMLGVGAAPEGGLGDQCGGAAATLLAIGVQNILAVEKLRRHSAHDALTGCFNREHALHMLESEMRRASRTKLPVSILMMDIDDFKGINDNHGHVTGDAVLTAVGHQLQRMLRQSDVRCRFGGDEFLVILPDTPLEAARTVADSVRHAIEKLVVPSVRGTVAVTVSLGVAASTGEADVAAFIDRADVGLYRAKQAGRNCVCDRLAGSVHASGQQARWAQAQSA